jgi:hypothetical protein
MADSNREHGYRTRPGASNDSRERQGPDQLQNFWSDYTIIHCRDGKSRRIPQAPEREFFRVVDEFSAGVDRSGPSRSRFPLSHEKIEGRAKLLRAIGNAIVPAVAAEFIGAFMDYEETI